MEHGSHSFGHGRSTQSSSDNETTNIENANNNINNNIGTGIENQQLQGTIDEETHMPIKNVTRIMQRAIPPNRRISKGAKESIQLCVTEFMNIVTSEANERCKAESRQIISGEDLIWAMDRLGFEDYVGPLLLYHQKYLNHEAQLDSMRLYKDMSGASGSNIGGANGQN
ncbi:nuclear transcription factor Y subunit B-1-like [Vicia villosa]|uniref:nuclear transcription factor Y subunit B-1-like n=1 Tax=Vicia villosa TaxID=3911 RepID=UPI00273C4475|nr:nuclear transcription factor Y subunit B-1-like [Vicia villosa]XP_058728515.1 nuclear transcription factor Y subunit B-1-like [Vicia villosa]